MIIIVSADPNWGIGKDGDLLYHVPSDMAFFRKTTTGNVVVMGRKTLESLPGGKPLPNRTSIVLSRDESFQQEGVTVCHNIPELLEELSKYDPDEVFVMGGAEIYRLLLPYCSKALITRWGTVSQADSFLPDFDNLPNWRMTDESEIIHENGVDFRFCTYVNNDNQL